MQKRTLDPCVWGEGGGRLCRVLQGHGEAETPRGSWCVCDTSSASTLTLGVSIITSLALWAVSSSERAGAFFLLCTVGTAVTTPSVPLRRVQKVQDGSPTSAPSSRLPLKVYECISPVTSLYSRGGRDQSDSVQSCFLFLPDHTFNPP